MLLLRLALCATLAWLHAAPASAGLLRERYAYSLSASTLVKNELDLGTSFVVDVVELPPKAGSNVTALELVVSDVHVVHNVEGGRMRGKLPLDVQLAYAQPFYLLVGSSGGLEEVRHMVARVRAAPMRRPVLACGQFLRRSCAHLAFFSEVPPPPV